MILSDQAAIAESAQTIGLSESKLPSIFSMAAAWMKRLQSDVEVGPALSTLIYRADLIDDGVRVRHVAGLHHARTAGCERNDKSLRISRVFLMQIRRRGFEMRLVIQGNSAPAPLADLTLIRAGARGRRWADDLLTGRVESIAAIAKRQS